MSIFQISDSNKKIKVALFQPEIPQNTGTIIRTCSAFNIPLLIIHPCSFIFDNKLLKRSAMDYISNVNITHFENFSSFINFAKKEKHRILATKIPLTMTENQNTLATKIPLTMAENQNTLATKIPLAMAENQNTLENNAIKSCPYYDFKFIETDIILLGKESTGLPSEIDPYIDENIYIPMHQNSRSLNLAIAMSIITSHALLYLNKLI